MKKAFQYFISLSLLLSLYAFTRSEAPHNDFTATADSTTEIDLKAEAFEILNAKCNSCHRKQNPFKVFSLRNMEKHAPKIYAQVFVYRRMPKGGKAQLTDEEYQTLKNWLNSLNTF